MNTGMTVMEGTLCGGAADAAGTTTAAARTSCLGMVRRRQAAHRGGRRLLHARHPCESALMALECAT